MQAVDALRLKLPADNGSDGTGPTGEPGLHQQAGRIEFEIFAVDAERGAIGGLADAGPFSADAKIGRGLLDAIHIVLSPPTRHLGGIGDGFEDAGGRGGHYDVGWDGTAVADGG